MSAWPACATHLRGMLLAHAIRVPHTVALTRTNDGTGADGLEVLQVGAREPAVGIRRVDALGGEVVKLAEVGVHDDLLLVRVFERLAPRDRALALRRDGGATVQSRDIATQHLGHEKLRIGGINHPSGCAHGQTWFARAIARTVHQHGLGNVIRVVACYDSVGFKHRRAAVERLAPENTAERT